MKKRYSKEGLINAWMFALVCLVLGIILGIIGLLYIYGIIDNVL